MALLALLFPTAFLRGEVISPAGILYVTPPWSEYKPAGFYRADNPLMVDIVTLFYPMYYEVERSFERGEWPLWNRLELGGMPLLANYETAIFYPPRLLFNVFDVPTAMSFYIMLKLWLCGMTAFICGLGLNLSRVASRFFSIGWMLATYNVMFAPWSLPDVSAWIPILFLGVHHIAEGRYRYGATIAGLGATLLLFAGHPELAFGGALGVGLYFLFRLGVPWRGMGHVLRAMGACAVFWLIALAITSVQVIPFVEYYLHSSHGNREHLIRSAFFKLGNVVAYWVPRFFGLKADYTYWGNASTLDYSMLYPGVTVWIGIAALAAVRGTWKSPMVLALAGAALLHVALAFQAMGFDVVRQLPVLHVMAPYWYSVFAIFALPLLAAVGIDTWQRRRPPIRRCLAGAAVLAPGVVIVAFAYQFHYGIMGAMGVREYVMQQVTIFAALLATGVGVVLVGSATGRHRLAAHLLTVVLAADLLIAARSINPTMPREQVYPETALTNFLQELPQPCRVGVAQAHIVSGIMANYGIEEWLGYDGLYPERVLRLQIELGPDIWTSFEPACAIQYYLYDPAFPPDFPIDEPGRFTRVATLDTIEVYRNNWALPHAFFSERIEPAESEDALFERLKSPEFDPRKTALVVNGAAPDHLPPPARTPGTATVEKRTATYVQITTQTDTPQILVLADAYYPGWKARIDGEAADVFPVFYAFRGTTVPAGSHTVQYFYRPWSFYGSLIFSTGALLAMLGWGLWRWTRITRAATRQGKNAVVY